MAETHKLKFHLRALRLKFRCEVSLWSFVVKFRCEVSLWSFVVKFHVKQGEVSTQARWSFRLVRSRALLIQALERPAAFGLGPLSGLNQQSPRAYQPETQKLSPPRPRPPPLEVSSFYTFMAACSVSPPHALGTCWLVKGLKCHGMDTWTGYQAFSFSLELFHLDQVSLSTCEYTHHVIIHVLLRCHSVQLFKPKPRAWMAGHDQRFMPCLWALWLAQTVATITWQVWNVQSCTAQTGTVMLNEIQSVTHVCALQPFPARCLQA